jgi:superfamily II DNA or RNA helicase
MAYDEDTIVVADKIYVPASHVDLERVEKHYVHHLFKEVACARCPNRSQRPNFECHQCPSFNGSVQTYSVVYKNGIEYVGFPMGERLNLEDKFGLSFEDFDFIDRRIKNRFDYKITSTIKLRDHQKVSIDEWWQYKYGLIVAPPRSGKTVVMLELAVRLGLRAILLANQHEFLQQFIDHVEEYTNLPELEEKYHKKLYGFPKKITDFDTLQIAVCTYQQFTSKVSGKERFIRMNRNFGTVLVDECHKTGANEFARVLNSSLARIRMGVTGTDQRKDGRHKITFDIVGNVVNRSTIAQMKPAVIVHVCDYVVSRSTYRGPAGYTYATKFLAEHKKRNEEILKFIGEDLKKGHCIVIPVTLKAYVWDLVKSINDTYGENTAEGFVGGTSKKQKDIREAILSRAKSRETRVIVGIRSLLQLGLNVPSWSAIYNIVPMSNEPNWKQESSRILTPDKNKRRPIIRMFVDPHIGLSLGCFVSTYKQCIKFGYEPSEVARQRALTMFEAHGSGQRGLDEAEESAMYGIEHEPSPLAETKPSKKSVNTREIRRKPLGKTNGLFGGSR